MANFPSLQTGASAQYPLTRVLKYRTHVVRFVDGSEQRSRECRGPKRVWVIGLEMLNDVEMQSFAEFAESMRGVAGSFSFMDPLDGTVYPGCALDRDVAEFIWDGEDRGHVQLVVREKTD